MATKFYLPSTGAAPVTVANATWGDSTSASPSKLKAVTTRIGSGWTTKTVDDADSAEQNFLIGQWVSSPIDAFSFTTSQTVAMSLRCSETGTGNNMFLRANIRVVSNDGGTVRGTIFDSAATNQGNELPTSFASRYGFEVGAGPSVVVVDSGMARTMTSTTMQKDIYAFVFSQQGLMAGVGLQGNKITKLKK